MAETSSWKRYSGSGYSSTSSEVKSHSSVLFNERLNIVFMMYDDIAMKLEESPSIHKILKAKSILASLWRNVRPLVSNNPKARHILGLDTNKQGIYTPDSGFAHIQECITEMITYKAYDYVKLIYTVQQIQNVESIIREILQFFSYFIRTEFKQIPDINIAGEKYKNMADERTVNEFKDLIGNKDKLISPYIEKPVDDNYFDELTDYLSDETIDDTEQEDELIEKINSVTTNTLQQGGEDK